MWSLFVFHVVYGRLFVYRAQPPSMFARMRSTLGDSAPVRPASRKADDFQWLTAPSQMASDGIWGASIQSPRASLPSRVPSAELRGGIAVGALVAAFLGTRQRAILAVSDESVERISVKLSKPLGAVLEETDRGVIVADLEEGGSALRSDLLKKGDLIIAVMDSDVSAMPFDDVLGLLQAAPDELTLKITRSKPLVAPADARPRQSEQPDKLEAAFQKNFGSPEAAGKLGTKLWKTVTNPVTWKNSIYFWSLMSVVVPLVLIAGYSAVK